VAVVESIPPLKITTAFILFLYLNFITSTKFNFSYLYLPYSSSLPSFTISLFHSFTISLLLYNFTKKGLLMIDFENRSDYEFDISKLEKIYSDLTQKDVELILTDDKEIQELNKTYRNKDKPTDVLSFPLEDLPGMPLGSIIISVDTAKRGAQEFGHSIDDEITLLFIHGLLHLLGYDHEVDNGEMRAKEEEIIKKYGLPDSLIVRNS